MIIKIKGDCMHITHYVCDGHKHFPWSQTSTLGINQVIQYEGGVKIDTHCCYHFIICIIAHTHILGINHDLLSLF